MIMTTRGVVTLVSVMLFWGVKNDLYGFGYVLLSYIGDVFIEASMA